MFRIAQFGSGKLNLGGMPMEPHVIALLQSPRRTRIAMRQAFLHQIGRYPALFTLTTVIFSKPSSNSGRLQLLGHLAHDVFAD